MRFLSLETIGNLNGNSQEKSFHSTLGFNSLPITFSTVSFLNLNNIIQSIFSIILLISLPSIFKNNIIIKTITFIIPIILIFYLFFIYLILCIIKINNIEHETPIQNKYQV
jgi:uncharacterized membrane protein YcaP (DUF421 family)